LLSKVKEKVKVED